MSIQCPLCESKQIITLDKAKKTGGIIGSVGGAASGVAGLLQALNLVLLLVWWRVQLEWPLVVLRVQFLVC